MNIAHFFKRVEKITIDNSPTILTAFGIAGVVSTAYLTGKASIKADEILREERSLLEARYEPEVRHELTTKEVVQLVWKCYIPPVSSGILTIGAIIGANHVNIRRATALATAYSISERTFSEYKDKVVEKLGEKKERAVRDELAQDRVNNNPVDNNTVIITDNGEVLCYDHFTGRYFKSSMEALKKAENEVNFLIINHGYACVSDLYEYLGLKPTSFSEEVGWNTDKPLELRYSTVLSEDGRPCISIDFDLSPKRKFSHYAE